MSSLKTIVVDLAISESQMQRYYMRPGAVVEAVARSGQSVRFPANILHPYITHVGIYGCFEISFTPQGKFQAIRLLP